MKAFVAVADLRFGPITTIRRKGAPPKKIPWSAFMLSDDDWERVNLCGKILEEKKSRDPDYGLFHDALKAGLSKLDKYYKRLNNADIYILALLIHPYYKFEYIEHQWGGEAEYLADVTAGIPNPRNWVAYAREVVKKAPIRFGRPTADAARPGAEELSPTGTDSDDEYDRARQAMLRRGEPEDGWKLELKSWFKDRGTPEVKKDMDTVKYWECFHRSWPTLGRMSIDILPIAAASVSTDRRSTLDPELFEQIECLKYYWKPKLVDYARANQDTIEEIYLQEFESMEKAERIIAEAYGNDDVPSGSDSD
ncbi:hypothetical protein BD310DRAFT_982181 [Dichomitus squalens]|uniref:HAT C-terminal dimerisation domain-containing protein n=1 Tax=Dichomitus squalens TaxID=114155 RepID=A0A4Q9PBT3_9APHY|nr:hypothetical protein BD310DRAFT_982181 [Dichomitus squalens]